MLGLMRELTIAFWRRGVCSYHRKKGRLDDRMCGRDCLQERLDRQGKTFTLCQKVLKNRLWKVFKEFGRGVGPCPLSL
jgi:hypothetical protein